MSKEEPCLGEVTVYQEEAGEKGTEKTCLWVTKLSVCFLQTISFKAHRSDRVGSINRLLEDEVLRVQNGVKIICPRSQHLQMVKQ